MTDTLSRARRESCLWLLQRGSAVLMLPLVAGHLFLMILAVRGGLSAAGILGRTQGNLPLAAFYGLFVLCASLHAALGLRTWLAETFAWRGRRLDGVAASLCLLLIITGERAAWAVYSIPA